MSRVWIAVFPRPDVMLEEIESAARDALEPFCLGDLVQLGVEPAEDSGAVKVHLKGDILSYSVIDAVAQAVRAFEPQRIAKREAAPCPSALEFPVAVRRDDSSYLFSSTLIHDRAGRYERFVDLILAPEKALSLRLVDNVGAVSAREIVDLADLLEAWTPAFQARLEAER